MAVEQSYTQVRDGVRRASKIWAIFVPCWFLGSIVSTSAASALPESLKALKYLSGLVPVASLLLVWLWVVSRSGGIFGPTKLACKKCGAPAYRWTGFRHVFHDACPSCGNDNTKDGGNES
jgi:hypothetical protein